MNIRNKNKKIRIGVMYGGPSSEHDVSLKSAAQVIRYLDKTKYDIIDIKISRLGAWPKKYKFHNLRQEIDIAYIVMHGSYGEDGTVQALLQAAGVPHTGSGVLASALAMDKWRSSLIASQIGLRAPTSALLTSTDIDFTTFASKVVIKPNNGGSSIGVEIVSLSNIQKRLKLGELDGSELLLQDYISGREVTVSVIGNHDPIALPVIEIIPKTKFYDFTAKYALNGSQHVVPAALNIALTKAVQTAAVQIHRALGCTGASRSDFIIDERNKIWYLETNTIPGMTTTSLLPQAAESAGISFSALLDRLIELTI